MEQVNIYPEYYDDFRCIADKCPDSCCTQWEIVVDDAAADIYERIDGNIGKKLRSSMTIDADGDRIFILENDRCPFLEKSGLCEIHKILGEDCLCSTCREYPRAVQDCGDFAQHDLSLSCPEAARIILSLDKEPSMTERIICVCDEDICYDYEFMEFIKFSRRQLLDIIWDKSASIDKLVEKCVIYAFHIQEHIDNGELDFVFFCEDISVNIVGIDFSYKKILKECLESDILTDEFRYYLNEAMCFGDIPLDSYEFSAAKKAIDSFENIFRQLCTHYINRYWLRAAFDGEALEKVLIMTRAFVIVRRLCLVYYEKNKELSFDEVIRIVQLYSKETEHNTDNM